MPVTTTIGVEGMELVPGSDIMVADDAAGLADAIVGAYLDEEHWSGLAGSGAAAVDAQFGRQATHRYVSELIERLDAVRAARTLVT